MLTTHEMNLDQAVFCPRSIGLVGLSDNAAKPTGRVLRLLRNGGYRGNIHAVNPRRQTVQGLQAYPALSDLPEVPDHVYALVATAHVAGVVDECAEQGVPVVTVLADGFAETGSEGLAAQLALVDRAREAGTRLLGPNSMGIADLHAGTWLTVNAIYEEPDHIAGPVALLSQSGSMMGGVISRAKALGIGFSRIAGVGNEADLGIAELGQMVLRDPNTEVVLLFLETIRDADGLARLAASAHEAGKPVIAYKLGRSTVGQQLAVAHTGALLAEDAVVDAFLRDVGIARIRTLDGLIEAPALFAGQRPPSRPPRIGVMTTTGGGGATVCDQLALADVCIQRPARATFDKVRSTGLNIVDGPMLDLTLAGAGAAYVKAAVEAMASDTETDMILSVTGSSGRSAPQRTVDALVAGERHGKPLTAFVTPDAPETLGKLLEVGIPVARTPESCADVIGAYARWRIPRVASRPAAVFVGATCALDEKASFERLAALGVPVVQHIEIYPDQIPETLPFGYPMVVKLLSDAVAHKTEIGGVITGIRNRDELAIAVSSICQNLANQVPGVAADRLLVAPMIDDVVQEVLIGYRRDAQIGPVITLAPGGVLVGLYDDKSVRLAPVDTRTAQEMVLEVRGLAPTRGHRNRPAGDADALADAISALSQLAFDPDVVEAEANPLMVRTSGVVAVDALVTLAERRP